MTRISARNLSVKDQMFVHKKTKNVTHIDHAFNDTKFIANRNKCLCRQMRDRERRGTSGKDAVETHGILSRDDQVQSS